jgi:hypothetical protein
MSPSRWTSFVADRTPERPRILHEDGNPRHRLRYKDGAGDGDGGAGRDRG